MALNPKFRSHVEEACILLSLSTLSLEAQAGRNLYSLSNSQRRGAIMYKLYSR